MAARRIVVAFDDTPNITFEALKRAIDDEQDLVRRFRLYSDLRGLNFTGRLDFLVQTYHNEPNEIIKAVIASHIIRETGTDCPNHVVELLARQVFVNTPSDIQKRTLWTDGLFPEYAIPLAWARPSMYEQVLQWSLEYHQTHEISLSWEIPATTFLVFALGWSGKPDFDNLNPSQVKAITMVFRQSYTIYQNGWVGHSPGLSALRYLGLPADYGEMKHFLDGYGILLEKSALTRP